MASIPAPGPSGFSRRAFLAGTAGLALAVAGCTSGDDGGAPPVTPAQADQLAGQVAVQEALVAAYGAATAADPALAAGIGALAGQAGEQLDRLRAAAPGATSSSAGPAPAPGPDVRGWLRAQVGTAAAAHEQACVDQAGPRAALLGSIAAGLRGHEAALA
ncbi:hypothetical protein [Blastococcus sp. SYSU D00820]